MKVKASKFLFIVVYLVCITILYNKASFWSGVIRIKSNKVPNTFFGIYNILALS